MKKMALVIACAMFVVLAAGCFTHTYQLGSGAPEGTEVYNRGWETHWFFGIIAGPEVNVKDVCPSGNATIEDEVSFLNGLVGSFIGIVWYPSSVIIKCAEGDGSSDESSDDSSGESSGESATSEETGMVDVLLSPARMARIVASPEFIEAVTLLAPENLGPALAAQENAEQFLAASGR